MASHLRSSRTVILFPCMYWLLLLLLYLTHFSAAVRYRGAQRVTACLGCMKELREFEATFKKHGFPPADENAIASNLAQVCGEGRALREEECDHFSELIFKTARLELLCVMMDECAYSAEDDPGFRHRQGNPRELIKHGSLFHFRASNSRECDLPKCGATAAVCARVCSCSAGEVCATACLRCFIRTTLACGACFDQG